MQKGFYELLAANFMRSIPHSKDCGMRIERLDDAGAWASLPFRPEWLGDTERGLIHTGIVTTLVDTVMGLAAVAAARQFEPIATLDLRMDYLRPAVPDKTLHCHAECFRMTRSIAFLRATAWQDSEAEPVAVSQAAFMRGSRTRRSQLSGEPT